MVTKKGDEQTFGSELGAGALNEFIEAQEPRFAQRRRRLSLPFVEQMCDLVLCEALGILSQELNKSPRIATKGARVGLSSSGERLGEDSVRRGHGVVLQSRERLIPSRSVSLVPTTGEAN